MKWAEAAAELPRMARARRAAAAVGHGAIVIGITGPVGAGKSTLAGMMSECVVSTDSYLPDYEAVPYAERDDPERADFAALVRDVGVLRAGGVAFVPEWSFITHRREGAREVSPRDVIVVEGIHALHGEMMKMLDLAVFVESPRSVRWSRWEWLEATGVRGWGVEVARRFFDEVAEPTFEKYEALYREMADVVVVNERGVPG